MTFTKLSRRTSAAILKVCLSIRKHKEWKENGIATVASVYPEHQYLEHSEDIQVS